MEPQAKALDLVPETMALVYRVLPLTFEEGVLSVVVSEEDKSTLTDLENFLGVREIRCVITPRDEIEIETAKAYTRRT